MDVLPYGIYFVNNKNLTHEISNSALSFIVLYFITFIIGTLIMITIGLDGKTASSSVATCMAGIGPGIGSVGPASNFAHIPEIGKVILTLLMIIGRLDICYSDDRSTLKALNYYNQARNIALSLKIPLV